MGTPGDEAETTLPPKPVAPQPAWKRALLYAKAAIEAHPDRALAFVLGFLACAVLWRLW